MTPSLVVPHATFHSSGPADSVRHGGASEDPSGVFVGKVLVEEPSGTDGSSHA